MNPILLITHLAMALPAKSQTSLVETKEICSIILEDQPCSSLPIFDGCHRQFNLLNLNLIRFFLADDPTLKSSIKLATVRYIIARRFLISLTYDQPARSITLHLMEGKCCSRPDIAMAISYIRSAPDVPCPTLLASTTPDDLNLECIPLFLGLFNVLILGQNQNLVLIRGRGYALLLTSNMNADDTTQFRWFEQMIEFGLWTGKDIQVGSALTEPCNCSTMELFREWHASCRKTRRVPSNQTKPMFSTEKGQIKDGLTQSDVEKWVICGIVCLLVALVGVLSCIY